MWFYKLSVYWLKDIFLSTWILIYQANRSSLEIVSWPCSHFQSKLPVDKWLKHSGRDVVISLSHPPKTARQQQQQQHANCVKWVFIYDHTGSLRRTKFKLVWLFFISHLIPHCYWPGDESPFKGKLFQSRLAKHKQSLSCLDKLVVNSFCA